MSWQIYLQIELRPEYNRKVDMRLYHYLQYTLLKHPNVVADWENEQHMHA